MMQCEPARVFLTNNIIYLEPDPRLQTLRWLVPSHTATLLPQSIRFPLYRAYYVSEKNTSLMKQLHVNH